MLMYKLGGTHFDARKALAHPRFVIQFTLVFLACFVTALIAGRLFLLIYPAHASGLTITSIEGNMITNANNPGGYPNNTPSTSPDNGTNFSPAFGKPSIDTQLIVNGTGFPNPNDTIPINASRIASSPDGAFTCFLSSNDNWLYCWGANISGELASGDRVAHVTPQPIIRGDISPSEVIVDFSVGNRTGASCVLTDIGQAYCWGNQPSLGGMQNGYPTLIPNGDIPSEDTIKRIVSSSTNKICVITSSDQLYCLSSESNQRFQKIKTRSDGGVMPDAVLDISISTNSYCAIASDHMVYCWGSNTFGQLGDNTTVNRTEPAAIYEMQDTSFTQVSVGGLSACALTDDHLIYCWGLNNVGQLGNGTTIASSVPVQVTTSEQFSALSAKGGGDWNNHGGYCAISTSGSPYCWGALPANGGGSIQNVQAPTKIKTQSDGGIMPDQISDITIGGDTQSGGNIIVCAIANDSAPYCLGRVSNFSNNPWLGNGSYNNSDDPVQVIRLASSPPDILVGSQYGAPCNSVRVISTTQLQCRPDTLNDLAGGTYDITVIHNNDVTTLAQSYKWVTQSGQPTDFVATPRNESVHLSWNKVIDKPYYNTANITIKCRRADVPGAQWVNPLLYSCDNSAYGSYQGINFHLKFNSVNETDIVGLTNGVPYDFYIYQETENPAEVYAYNVTPLASAYVPDAPTVTDVTLSGSTVTVSWEPGANDGGSPVTNYAFRVQDNGKTGWGMICGWLGTATTTNQCVSASSIWGQNVTIQLVAINANGASVPSEPITYYIPSANRPPNTPANIKINNVNTDRALISWSRPSNNGSPITSYEVRYSIDPAFSTSANCVSNTGNPVTAACMTPSLPIGTKYYFQVRAINNNGASDWSIMHATVIGAPDRPVITGLTTGNTVIDLTWDAPNDNGSAITGYVIERSTSPIFDSISTISLDSVWISSNCQQSSCSISDSGLINGTIYYYQVVATNSRGDSLPSDPASGIPYAAPTVDSIYPSSGFTSGNQIITISGSNLNGATSVTIGGNPCVSFMVADPDTIICLTPPGTVGAKDVFVANLGGSSTLPASFTYITPPNVTAVSPPRGATAGGYVIQIIGTDFTSDITNIKIDNNNCINFNIDSPTQISCMVPPRNQAGAVNITLETTSGSIIKTNLFTYVSPPVITSITPAVGPTTGGTVLTISGGNFHNITEVTIGEESCASFTFINLGQILCTTPPHTAGFVDVAITTDGGGTVTKTDGFRYVLAPSIASISPDQGPMSGGNFVMILGDNFFNVSYVTIDDKPCTGLVIHSPKSLSCTIPAHTESGAYDVIVHSANGSSPSDSGGGHEGYTYLPNPTITNISPSTGPGSGGTEVTITGTNFTIPSSDPIYFTACGMPQTFTAPVTGLYTIEAWGGQGFNNDATGLTLNGKGGYAKGDISLSAGQRIFPYVGCAGTRTTGGWNGGGDAITSYAAPTGNAGGGATDFRLIRATNPTDYTSLMSRVLVAGGGGGTITSPTSRADHSAAGTESNYGGRQGGIGTASVTPCSQAGFGFGASCDLGANNSYSGGGGGWYGGGSSGNYYGGGGSNYALTDSSNKTGYGDNSPNPLYYLSNTQTIAGNAVNSMPDPSGLATKTGNSGNGLAKVTPQHTYTSPLVLLQTAEDDNPAICIVSTWTASSITCTTSSHADAVVDVVVTGANGTVTLSDAFEYSTYLTLDVGDLDLGSVLPSSAGEYISGSHTLSVQTNAALGYNLSISTDTSNSLMQNPLGSAISATNNLCNWSNNSLSSPSMPIIANTWGFSTSSSNTTSQQLCQAPTINSPLRIKQTTTSSMSAPGDQTQVYYGAKADLSQDIGVYTVNILYTLAPNL